MALPYLNESWLGISKHYPPVFCALNVLYLFLLLDLLVSLSLKQTNTHILPLAAHSV